MVACAPHASYLRIQRNSREQIWRAEPSQVQIRAAQSRTFEGADESEILRAAIATFQDLGFQVAVLDETLGVVSGRKWDHVREPPAVHDPYYVQYRDESLIPFTRTYRTWGPFRNREDLIRLTVTIRRRNDEQLVVRASAQFCLQPVETPEPYQRFFTALERRIFTGGHRSGS